MRSSFITLSMLLIPATIGCRAAMPVSAIETPSASLSADHANQSPPEAVDIEHEAPPEKAQEEALAEVIGELSEIGALDPDAKRLLMADLKQAKPENWPLIVRQFRSALAYRQQLAEREQQRSDESLTPATATKPLLAQHEPAEKEIQSLKSEPQAVAVSFDATEKQSTVVVTPVNHNSLPVETEVLEPSAISKKPTTQVAQQVNYLRSIDPVRDWQDHLNSAVEVLQTTVDPAPVSTGEVNQHMRLRLLQLLAGDEESALQPIPGASASQQDYWSKQLFAVSVFLDSQSQPDNKRRAASSLMHLDQARAKLAELATLQVRKLSFVDSVEGYGAYTARETTKFRPGEQVTLYAEIENFHSESTKDGYRTRLASSYEVVDKSGKRVDSAQFPEVEDVCRSPRRDFHMQYTVTLPTAIYPEQYEIRLIITDQQSHKIGQAKVPFEISK